jgi:Uma2 family endonuclease
MAEGAIQFTYDDYLSFPYDLKIHQIVEGEHYVNPSPVPYHQAISGRLFRILADFVESRNLGQVFAAPIDVVLSNINVVVPDIIFISREKERIIGEKCISGPPDLIVEILSEGTKKLDKDLKSKLYAKFGVMEYWIVDPKEKAITVCRFSNKRYQTTIFTAAEELTTPTFSRLRISLVDIFRR